MWSESDLEYMILALKAAQSALDLGEVPGGAVLVCHGEVLAVEHNRPITRHDPTAHAEMEALRSAGARRANYRLPDATLFVTLEPCAMCAGALVNARIKRLVFAARDLRFGAARTHFGLADSDLLNHKVCVEEGLLAAESAALLSGFFAKKRVSSRRS